MSVDNYERHIMDKTKLATTKQMEKELDKTMATCVKVSLDAMNTDAFKKDQENQMAINFIDNCGGLAVYSVTPPNDIVLYGALSAVANNIRQFVTVDGANERLSCFNHLLNMTNMLEEKELTGPIRTHHSLMASPRDSIAFYADSSRDETGDIHITLTLTARTYHITELHRLINIGTIINIALQERLFFSAKNLKVNPCSYIMLPNPNNKPPIKQLNTSEAFIFNSGNTTVLNAARRFSGAQNAKNLETLFKPFSVPLNTNGRVPIHFPLDVV